MCVVGLRWKVIPLAKPEFGLCHYYYYSCNYNIKNNDDDNNNNNN